MRMNHLLLGIILFVLITTGCRKEKAEEPALLTTLDEVTDYLELNSTTTVRPYATFEFGRQRDSSAVSIIVNEHTAMNKLADIRKSLAPNIIAYLGTTRWLGDEVHEGVEMVFIEGTDQFDILRTAQSNAANYGMDTDDLIEKLKSYNDQFGISIYWAETDMIQFSLLSLPSDTRAFAEDLYTFCPDIVDQGIGSVEALEQGIKDYKLAYLWWD